MRPRLISVGYPQHNVMEGDIVEAKPRRLIGLMSMAGWLALTEVNNSSAAVTECLFNGFLSENIKQTIVSSELSSDDQLPVSRELGNAASMHRFSAMVQCVSL